GHGLLAQRLPATRPGGADPPGGADGRPAAGRAGRRGPGLAVRHPDAAGAGRLRTAADGGDGAGGARLGVRRARPGPAGPARGAGPPPVHRPVRADAVRGRDRGAAGAPVRAGHGAAAHGRRRHRRPGARAAAGGGVAAARPAHRARGGPRGGPVTPPRQRLHPLSPLLHGAKLLAAIVAAVSVQGAVRLGPAGFVGLLVTVMCLAGAASTVSWVGTGHHVVGRELPIERGVRVPHTRTRPLERLQAVDVVRPLLARMFGLAELRLEVVGSGKTEAPLAFLTVTDAVALRERLLAVATSAGAPVAAGSPVTGGAGAGGAVSGGGGYPAPAPAAAPAAGGQPFRPPPGVVVAPPVPGTPPVA